MVGISRKTYKISVSIHLRFTKLNFYKAPKLQLMVQMSSGISNLNPKPKV